MLQVSYREKTKMDTKEAVISFLICFSFSDLESIVKPTCLLCLSCHTEKGSGRRIIAGYVYGNRHPTHGVLDPLRKGRELTCASCHNPHASDSSKFIRLNAGRGFELCGKCHINNERKLLFPYQVP